MSLYDTEGVIMVKNEGGEGILPGDQGSPGNHVICFHMMIGLNLGRLKGAQRESLCEGPRQPCL